MAPANMVAPAIIIPNRFSLLIVACAPCTFPGSPRSYAGCRRTSSFELMLVVQSNRHDVVVEAARSGWPHRPILSIPVVIPVAANRPPVVHFPGKVGIWRLELRLQGSRHRARIQQFHVPVDGRDAIAEAVLDLLDRRQHDAHRTVLHRSVIMAVADP